MPATLALAASMIRRALVRNAGFELLDVTVHDDHVGVGDVGVLRRGDAVVLLAGDGLPGRVFVESSTTKVERVLRESTSP